MSFTDDDLKRLNESYEVLREMKERGASEAELMSLTLPEFDALLHRLECAEKVCKNLSGTDEAQLDSYMDWLRSKGQSERKK